MTTAGIPIRKIGSPGMLPGDYFLPTPPPGSPLGVGTFGYSDLSTAQPTFNSLSFNFDTDLGMLSRNIPMVTYAASLNIRRFVDYGHKIIWFHGLSDPGPPVLGTIKYYEEMARQFGGLERVQQFSRFYPIPNMGHCGGPVGNGGPATDQFDPVTPLANWVENGVPPGPINATGVNFTPDVSNLLRAGAGYPDAPIMSVSPAGALHRQRIGHRRCARCDQPGGFG
jgi:hypothetical protein